LIKAKLERRSMCKPTLRSEEISRTTRTSVQYEIVGGKPPEGLLSTGCSKGKWIVTVTNPKSGPFAYIVRASDGPDSVDHTVSGIIPSANDETDSIADAIDNVPPTHCPEWATHPDHKLFLKNWLTNFFDKINGVTEKAEAGYQPPLCDVGDPRKSFSPNLGTPCIPNGTSFTQVDLATSFQIAADLSGGLAPSLLGDGKVFLIPVSGLTGDLNFDYSHEIDITLKLCDNTKPGGCKSANSAGSIDPMTPTSNLQCQAYAALSPILSSVTPPKEVVNESNQTLTCSKALGCYVLKKTDPKASAREPSTADCAKMAVLSGVSVATKTRATQ
jgi:hypothetical protein